MNSSSTRVFHHTTWHHSSGSSGCKVKWEASGAVVSHRNVFNRFRGLFGNLRKWLGKAFWSLNCLYWMYRYSVVVKAREKLTGFQPIRVDDLRLLSFLAVFRCWAVDSFRAMSPSPSRKRTRYVWTWERSVVDSTSFTWLAYNWYSPQAA